VRRCWRQLDADRLRCDILESTLVTNPPDNVNDFFACYDDVLRHLIDLHVPARSVVIRPRPQSPWFDGECRDMKRATRRLERVYRSTHASDDYILWKKQLSIQRTLFQTKYADYWTSAIAECGHNGKALWSKVNCLLRPPPAASISSHTADDFATFFVRKVADIRSSTSGAPPAVIVPRDTPVFCQFEPVNVEEISHLLAVTPSKSCLLDPIPTWLLKQLSDILTPVITSLCNSSLSSGLFPDSHKRGIVLPRLKKPSLDRSNLSSYRPISNLSFLSKLVERVVASRFVSHAEENRLFQSTSRHTAKGTRRRRPCCVSITTSFVPLTRNASLLLCSWTSALRLTRWTTSLFFQFCRRDLELTAKL